MQDQLNKVTEDRFSARLKRGQETAQEAVASLIEEGKMLKDFVAPLGVNLKIKGDQPVITFDANGVVKMNLKGSSYNVHDHAMGHLGDKLGVPSRYIKGLASGKEQWQRDLASQILNDHTAGTDRNRVLIRTVGEDVRGVLSDSYRRLNTAEITESFIKAGYAQGAVLADGAHTDTKMFIEMLLPQLIEVPTEKNGILKVAVGAQLTNSDFGASALMLKTFMMNAVCTNGMTRDNVMRNVHLGSKLDENIEFSERTYKLDTRTKASAVNDATNTCFSDKVIESKVVEIQAASAIEVDMEAEINRLGKGAYYKDEVKEIKSIVTNSRNDDGVGGESTLWKLVSGVTAHAREVKPERSRELQDLAGRLLDRIK